MKLHRPEAPAELAQNWEKWGQDYQKKKLANPRYKFTWRQEHQGRTIHVNKLLFPLLRQMTKDHCSFCDGFPLFSRIKETIEHFKPKAIYYLEVYRWDNLFLCCYKCQFAKGKKFRDTLLKPDDTKYEFDKYFVVDFETGEISPNPASPPEEQQRAKDTISIYNLNDPERLTDRICEFRKYTSIPNPNLTDFSYRFMFL